MSTEHTHLRKVRLITAVGLLVTLLYFGSLGPAQVWHHRTCRSVDFQTAIRYEKTFGVYFSPAFFVMSHVPSVRRATARYVHWWIEVTHTRRPWRSSDYWYDEYGS